MTPRAGAPLPVATGRIPLTYLAKLPLQPRGPAGAAIMTGAARSRRPDRPSPGPETATGPPPPPRTPPPRARSPPRRELQLIGWTNTRRVRVAQDHAPGVPAALGLASSARAVEFGAG